MDKKLKLFDLIEYYINDYQKKSVEEYYGKGTKIKVRSLDYINSQKCILAEIKIVLSETINERVLNRELADVLIQDALVYFYPEHYVKVMVGWDV
jgi:hypothetical protein